MADLAVVFHWQPSELYELDLAELRRFRERAQERMPKKGR